MVTGIDNLISELDNLMAERRRITQAILSLTDRIHGLNHTGQEPISRPPDQPTTPEVEAIPPSNPAPSPVPAAVVGAVAAPDPRAGSVRSQAIRIIGDAGQISIGDLGLALYGIANRVTYRRAASLLTYLQTAGYARRAGRGLWVLKEGAPTGPEVETADDRVANHEAPPRIGASDPAIHAAECSRRTDLARAAGGFAANRQGSCVGRGRRRDASQASGCGTPAPAPGEGGARQSDA